MHTACSVASGLHRVLAARLADPSRTLLRLRCNLSLQPFVFRQLSIKSGFIIWPINGSQLHAFSQGRAFVYFVVHAHSIGDRRTETSSYVRQKKSLSFFLPLSLPLSLSLSLSLSLPVFFLFCFSSIFILISSSFLSSYLLKKKRKEKLTSPETLCVCVVCLRKKKKKKNTDGTASAFRKRLAFLALP